MKLKTIEVDGKTYAEVSDGKPIYIDGEKEIVFDAPGTVATISRLNGEAKGHREAKEAAEAALKTFDGIEDPAAAIEAVKQVKNFKDKDLVEAGEVDKIKNEAIKAVEEKYAPVVEENKTLKSSLHQEKIGGSFARSEFIAEKMAVPIPMVEATFGRHFTIENGKIIAKDASGNQVYSKANPGEPADFDEALEIIVESSPFKDNILKGRSQSGSGAQGGGGDGGGAKNITRSEYDALSHGERRKAMADGVKVVDQ